MKSLYTVFGGKKKFIWMAGIALIVLTFSGRFISIQHWYELDFVLPGYSPWAPVIGLAWSIMYMLILYVRKVWAPSLWFIGAAGLLYSGLLFWALWLH